MDLKRPVNKQKKKSYIFIYIALVIIMFIPPHAEKPYLQQQTPDVIKNLLMVVINPYVAYAPIFHIMTILLIILIILYKDKMSRIFTGYMGINYLIIGFASSIGTTEKYGFVVFTSALASCLIIGTIWIIETFKPKTITAFKSISPHLYFLLPLALLAFWSPVNSKIMPNFNPILLLNSPEYGLTFCLTTPVFLFLLILFYPKVNILNYKITAFIGLEFGILNMQWFFTPKMAWMGVLHLPLIILSLYALLLPVFSREKSAQTVDDRIILSLQNS